MKQGIGAEYCLEIFDIFCFLTVETMGPEDLSTWHYCDFSAMVDYEFKLWTKRNPSFLQLVFFGVRAEEK